MPLPGKSLLTPIGYQALVFGLCLFGVSVGLSAQTAPPSEEFLLAPGRAGRVEIGMPVDELYDLVGRDNTRLVDW